MGSGDGRGGWSVGSGLERTEFFSGPVVQLSRRRQRRTTREEHDGEAAAPIWVSGSDRGRSGVDVGPVPDQTPRKKRMREGNGEENIDVRGVENVQPVKGVCDIPIGYAQYPGGMGSNAGDVAVFTAGDEGWLIDGGTAAMWNDYKYDIRTILGKVGRKKTW